MGRPDPYGAALSARNPKVQQLRRLLRRRSSREEAGRYVIEGPRLVIEALDAGAEIDAVYVPVDAPEPGAEVAARSRARGVPVRWLAPGALEAVAATTTPQPALAVAEIPAPSLDDVIGPPGSSLVIVLVEVADPGNAGTLVRVAEAVGATGVICCGTSAVDPYNPKAVRAAAGSLFRLPVARRSDAVEALASVGRRGLVRIGAVARGGVAPEAVDWRGPIALVLGGEARGLSAEVLAELDHPVTIPMAPSVESLNVAVAGAVLAFEAARQRRGAGELIGRPDDPTAGCADDGP